MTITISNSNIEQKNQTTYDQEVRPEDYYRMGARDILKNIVHICDSGTKTETEKIQKIREYARQVRNNPEKVYVNFGLSQEQVKLWKNHFAPEPPTDSSDY